MTGYAEAYPLYLQQGWPAVLPLPLGSTGADSAGQDKMAAAHAQTTRIKNQALDDVLEHVLRTVPMSDEARKRIAEIPHQDSGDEG